MQTAHRVAYRLTKGAPGKFHVLHHCDNILCVNPGHLYLGTAATNAADRNRKGRQARGEKVNTAKLSSDQIKQIRIRSVNGETESRLANEFGVSQPAIFFIVHRMTWKHI